MLASLIRKLMEQLGRQNALIFIAGADDAWSALPRDVTPRMRAGAAAGGQPELDETRMLLESFTEGGPQLSRESIDHIYHLSGGNPREIPRIGYQALQRPAERSTEREPDDLIASAQASGTVRIATRAVRSASPTGARCLRHRLAAPRCRRGSRARIDSAADRPPSGARAAAP